MHSEGDDPPLTKLPNTVKGYKYYKAKKAESEKVKAAEEPEKQYVSPFRSGRGKGYMCSCDYEANVPKIITKQSTQQRRRNQLTIDKQIDNDVVDTYAEWGQKLKGTAVKDPAVHSLLDLRKGSKASRLESLRQKKASNIDLTDDEPKGDDDITRNEVFMYKKFTKTPKSTYFSLTVTSSSLDFIQNLLDETHVNELMDLMSNSVYTDTHTTSAVHNLVGNPEVRSFLSGASKVPFGTHVDVQATNLVLQEMFLDNATHHISSPPATITHKLPINPQPNLPQAKAKKLMQNKLTHPHPKRNFVPTAVATKSGQVPVNAAKQSSPRAAASVSTVRPVNTATLKPKVNDVLPITYSYFKAHSPLVLLREMGKMLLSPQHAGFGDQQEMVYGIFDSGCSRHMTGNKSFLIDYQEIDSGFVAFGGSPKGGKITGKGNQLLIWNAQVSRIIVNASTTQQYILLPLLYNSPHSLEDAVADDAEGDQNVQDFRAELDNLLVQQKEGYATSTNRVATVSPSVSAVRQSFDNPDDLPTDPLMPNLEDTTDLLNTGIFSGAYDDEDEGVEADLNNLETTVNVSPIPTTRIHKDHPKDQIIGDINSATQTRRMTKISKEHALKVIQTLADPSWIEAMQDELLQFRLQKVWRLVNLPKGKHAIGTKWVYRNKKDERGIVVRNKARLVAQGYIQEEGIDYDEVLCSCFTRYRKAIGYFCLLFGSTKKSLCVEFEQMMHKRF
ncbi:putative ribonuclease H-like domain-containing protein [Tanacetum coccineum]